MRNKDTLAKLLATENITVVREPCKTASFNVVDRVLRMPMWVDDMEDYTEDHLTGHEVGHALYTPSEGWHESVCEQGKAYKGYLNIIEDARIEKLVQRRYPGLRTSFIKSYRDLAEKGMFGDVSAIETYKLIDRINVHFKCGESFGVKFTEEEMVWVDEIAVAETWEQVVDIADRLFAEEKEKAKQEQEQNELDDSDSKEDGVPTDDASSGGESSDDMEDDIEDDTEEMDDSDESAESEESDIEDSIASDTDEMLRDGMQSMVDPTQHQRSTVVLEEIDASQYIVGYKDLLSVPFAEYFNQNTIEYNAYREDRETFSNLDKSMNDLLKTFMENNKKTISYMVKEFEMRKSASNYARATVSKTGIIDPVKMNNYKFSEDIFRKVSVVPDGKSHGVVMYLDWSGSMYRDLHNTVIQTLNLVYFCRQANIPFRVYSFTDNMYGDKFRSNHTDTLHNVTNDMPYFVVGNTRRAFALVEWFNNKMNKMELTEMAKRLLFISKDRHIGRYVTQDLNLGGTPLDFTILLASDIFKKFKAAHRLDIVNTIFLTDGDSHPVDAVRGMDVIGVSKMHDIIDKVTGKTYKGTGKYAYDYNSVTSKLLQIYQDRTGGNAIGYRIVSNKREMDALYHDKHLCTDIWRKMGKEKYHSTSQFGYSKLFLVRGGKSLEVEAGEFDVDRGAKKNRLTAAFKKAAKGKIQSRTLLNEFIQEVS